MVFLEERIQLTPETTVFTVLVACCPTESKCSSLIVLNDSDGVNVVPILSCPEIAKDFAEDILEKMKAWEATAFKALVEMLVIVLHGRL